MSLASRSALHISDFKKFDIPYSWSTVYVGRHLQMLSPQDAVDYAVEVLCAGSNNNELVVELAGTFDNAQADSLLEKVIQQMYGNLIPDTPAWQYEKRKLRYCILKELQKAGLAPSALLDKIELVYADFYYPSDMARFIPYMPEQDKDFDINQYTPAQLTQRLINFFNEFLESEKKSLQN